MIECISFFTRILGHPYQNSGTLKFHILDCISFYNVSSPVKKLTTVSYPLHVSVVLVVFDLSNGMDINVII